MVKYIADAYSGGEKGFFMISDRWLKRTPLVLFACLTLMYICTACGPGTDEGADADEITVPVEIQQVVRGDVARILRFTGDIEAQADVRVFSQIPDRILKLRIEEGDEVKAGQILAVIRSSALKESVSQARGGLDAARANVEGLKDLLARQERLRASGVIPEATIEATRNQLAAAQAQTRQLEAATGLANLRKTDAIVRAPISGIIGRLFLKIGDFAGPGIPICTVVQMERVKVSFDVPETEFLLVRRDMAVDVRLRALPEKTFSGRVTSVSPTIDLMSRTARVEVSLDNSEQILKPGMLAEVWIEVDRHTDVIRVPFDALMLDPRPDGMGYRAFVFTDGTAEERKLEVGYRDNGNVEITNGLKEGEQIIIEGKHLLQNGNRVRIVDTPADAQTEKQPASKTQEQPAEAEDEAGDVK